MTEKNRPYADNYEKCERCGGEYSIYDGKHSVDDCISALKKRLETLEEDQSIGGSAKLSGIEALTEEPTTEPTQREKLATLGVAVKRNREIANHMLGYLKGFSRSIECLAKDINTISDMLDEHMSSFKFGKAEEK